MDRVAELLWNPFLSVWYVVVGLFLLVVTGGAAIRRSFNLRELNLISKGNGTSGERPKRGQISHRQAFYSSLAAGVGVGNLAGVATALHLGGPGALFWMWISALLGMSFRLSSTYLAIRHRPSNRRSVVFATPMAYMDKLLGGKLSVLPVLLAALLILQGTISANLVQANSLAHGLNHSFGFSNGAIAIFLTAMVALVIIGGVKSIVRAGSLIAPWMMLTYVVIGLCALVTAPGRVAYSLVSVFYYAFNPYAMAGGVVSFTVLSTLQYGVSRGIFSHGSGIGIAPFLQASNDDHPAVGAYLAALVPVVDTLMICSITGLVILTFGNFHALTSSNLTISAFSNALGSLGEYVVLVSLVTFSFTTIVTWAHFSERCYQYLGGKNLIVFRWCFAGISFAGPFFPVAFVWSAGDVIIGLLLLVHLMPLIYGVLIDRPGMLKDLYAHRDGSR